MKIDYFKGGGVITWGQEDFLGGLVPQWAQNGNKKIGNGATFMVDADPYRALGYLYPSYPPATSVGTSVIYSALRNLAVFNGFAYGIERANTQTNAPGVHRITLSTDTISTTGGWPQVTATNYTGIDCAYMNVNTWNASANANKDIILFTGDSGTNGVLYAYNITNDVWDNNFTAKPVNGSSAGLYTGVPLVIRLSPYDGVAYITNGQYVCSYDPRTGDFGTINYTAFTLPYGYAASSFSELPTHLVIYAYNTGGGYNFVGGTPYHGSCRAFFWNRVNSQADFVFDLEDAYVDAGFNKNGTIGCFTYGRPKSADGKLSAIRIYDGTRFVIPENGTFSGNIPRHGAVDIVDDMVEFLSDGKRYSYGTPFPGLPPALVQKGTSGGSSIFGCLKNLTGTKTYVSSGADTSGGLQSFSANYANTFSWQGVTAEPDFPEALMGEITKVRTRFVTTASAGRSMGLTLTTDRGTTTTVYSGVTTITAQSTDESSTSKKLISEAVLDSSSAQFPAFSSIRPNFSSATGSGATDSPGIAELKVYFRNLTQ